MDTISRENSSMLPIGGVILGVVSLIVAIVAFAQAHSLKTQVAAHDTKLQGIPDDIAAQVTQLQSGKADKTDVSALHDQTVKAFNDVGNAIGAINEQIKHLQETPKHAVGKKGGGEPVVAGPGEYVVKPGDSGMKIARANGCSFADLKAVNPEVNWNKLHSGQKIKLPEKK